MRVPHDSFVLVADGRKRLLFRNEGDATALHLVVVDAAEDMNPKTHDQVTDAAGRMSAPVGQASTTFAHEGAHEVEEERFAADTAELLARHAQQGAFERLIVVAPAKTLGALRKHYDPVSKAKLAGEIPKDLTGHPVDRIETLLLAAHES